MTEIKKSYDYLDDIDYVLYVSSEEKVHLANLQDRTSTCNHGYWYEGCYGNCLIALKSNQTDKLYLLTKETYKEVYPLLVNSSESKLHLLMYLNHHAEIIVKKNDKGGIDVCKQHRK